MKSSYYTHATKPLNHRTSSNCKTNSYYYYYYYYYYYRNHNQNQNQDCSSTSNNVKHIQFSSTSLPCKILALFLLNAILTHLNQVIQNGQNDHRMPFIIQAEAMECSNDIDCGNKEKICHENKCICTRERPIEDQDRCLALALISEPCYVNEQCLGNSLCVEGICSCGNDAVNVFNPSTRIFYCHPKRRLRQDCNHDSQCPTNSFCSTKKNGCLCQNGFGPVAVVVDGIETEECLPKTCSNSSNCESEYHQCEDNKCKCLATHFDPHTAGCYKFGSTGGELTDDNNGDLSANNTTNVSGSGQDDENNNNLYSIFKDLMKNGDNFWLVIMILIIITIILFAFIFMIARKYYLGYCWTAHKKEYEPNNKSQPKNGHFNKNSINNKSFRQKMSGETEDDDYDDDNTAADRSNLVTTTTNKKDGALRTNQTSLSSSTTAAAGARGAFTTTSNKDGQHHYVKVDMNDNNNRETSDSSNGHYQPFHHRVVSPLASSTSTPV